MDSFRGFFLSGLNEVLLHGQSITDDGQKGFNLEKQTGVLALHWCVQTFTYREACGAVD